MLLWKPSYMQTWYSFPKRKITVEIRFLYLPLLTENGYLMHMFKESEKDGKGNFMYLGN